MCKHHEFAYTHAANSLQRSETTIPKLRHTFDLLNLREGRGASETSSNLGLPLFLRGGGGGGGGGGEFSKSGKAFWDKP